MEFKKHTLDATANTYPPQNHNLRFFLIVVVMVYIQVANAYE